MHVLFREAGPDDLHKKNGRVLRMDVLVSGVAVVRSYVPFAGAAALP